MELITKNGIWNLENLHFEVVLALSRPQRLRRLRDHAEQEPDDEPDRSRGDEEPDDFGQCFR